MQETTTATTKPMELIYWEHSVTREVYTDDGRLVGTLKGILVDPVAWTIPQLVIEVNKDDLEGLNLKKHMFGTVMVSIPSSIVRSASDVVQLNTNLAAMRDVIKIYEIKKT
jgi:sporulation protein YlmC with PRC-barrel domain